MRSLTIGLRLVLWYGAVLAGCLVAFSAIVHVTFSRNLLGEIDRALAEELTEIETVVRQESAPAALPRALRAGFEGHEFYEIQVIDPQGAVLFQTPGINDRLPDPGPEAGRQRATNIALADDRRFRVASRVVETPVGRFTIHAADSLQLYDREVRGLTVVLLGSIPVLLGLALAGGFWVSRRALAPVDQLTKAALAVSSTRLDRRVEVRNPGDELGRLAQAFNSMIERLERSFDEMRRFTADAAHELRTPLAVLRSGAEIALRAPRPVADYQNVLENQLEEVARLARLTDELLFLCREDAGLRSVGTQSVRADQVLEQLTGQLQAAAQARDVELQWEGLPPCKVPCDADRLRRLFFNLLDNALKYTRAGGTITVAGTVHNAKAEIRIRDTGIGIPAEHLPRVCQRFYRVDPARNDEIEGTGLGLAICQAIVDSQQGTLQFDSTVGQGTIVTVRLPIDSIPDRSPAAASGDEKTNVPGSAEAPGDGVWVGTQEVQMDRRLISRPA